MLLQRYMLESENNFSLNKKIMTPLVTQSLIGSIVASFLVYGGVVEMNVNEARNYTNYAWAYYTAESSIQKQLLTLKTEDVYVVDKANTYYSNAPSSALFDSINNGADTRYFDAHITATTQEEVNLWRVNGNDVTFMNIPTQYFFNAISFEYNKTDAESVEIVLTQAKLLPTDSRCNFLNYTTISGCTDISKIIINSDDSTLNWAFIGGFNITYSAWLNGFKNRVIVSGVNPDQYNYRVSSRTISGKPTDMRYTVMKNGVVAKIPSNTIEIGTVGNAIDNFARMKLQKNVTDQTASSINMVLFSNNNVNK